MSLRRGVEKSKKDETLDLKTKKRSLLDLTAEELQQVVLTGVLPETVTFEGLEAHPEFAKLFRLRHSPSSLAKSILSLKGVKMPDAEQERKRKDQEAFLQEQEHKRKERENKREEQRQEQERKRQERECRRKEQRQEQERKSEERKNKRMEREQAQERKERERECRRQERTSKAYTPVIPQEFRQKKLELKEKELKLAEQRLVRYTEIHQMLTDLQRGMNIALKSLAGILRCLRDGER